MIYYDNSYQRTKFVDKTKGNSFEFQVYLARSQHKPQLGLSQERDDKNTSCQCYASCTGFQSVNECGSNWPVSCTSHYLVRPPQYLVDDVQLLADSGRRLLRSANYRACVVPRTQNSFGDTAFAVAGPKILNNLPPETRHVDISFGQFINMLKSYFFKF